MTNFTFYQAKIILAFLWISFLYLPANAQWEDAGSNPVLNFNSYFTSSTDGKDPYIAFSDPAKAYKLSVKKFNGSQWVYVGTPGFSEDVVYGHSVFVKDQIVYVAYNDETVGSKITVQKFDGTSWSVVGQKGFGTAYTGIKSLSIVKDVLYLASNGYDRMVRVFKFNGTEWEDLPNSSFTGNDTNLNVVLKPYQDTLALMYYDYSDYIVVKTYKNDKWSILGKRRLSYAQGFSMNIDDNNVPYVVFSQTTSSKACVLKYTNSKWDTVGTTASIPQNGLLYPSLTFVRGIPFLGATQVMGNNGYPMVKKLENGVWVSYGGSLPGQFTDYNSLLSTGDNIYTIFRHANSGGTDYKTYVYVNKYTPPVATGLTLSDVADNNNASDMKVSFTKASSETNITAYRIFVVKSSDITGFDLAKAKTITSESYYETAPTGNDQSVILPANLLTTGGENVGSYGSYFVFIMSVGTSEEYDGLSARANRNLAMPVKPVTSITVSDISDNNNSSDIQVSIGRASSETDISSYRIFVLKESKVADFTLQMAINMGASRYKEVKPNGSDHTVVLNPTQTDTDGQPIVSGNSYAIIVLSVGGNAFSVISEASESFVLTTATGIAKNKIKGSDLYYTKDNLFLRNIPEPSNLQIFNLTGTRILNTDLNQGENIVDISAMNEGVYLIMITSEQGLTSGKIAK